jgi:hypothetical protein
VPFEEATASPDVSGTGDSAWDELARLGDEIASGWQFEKTSTELLSEMRR